MDKKRHKFFKILTRIDGYNKIQSTNRGALFYKASFLVSFSSVVFLRQDLDNGIFLSKLNYQNLKI